MSVCVVSAVLAMGLAVNAFELRWTHSVERTEWTETWVVDGTELVLQRATVQGSGAGMDPPPEAVFRQGRWEYRVPRRVQALHLAASGATVGGWQWCVGGACQDLEALMALGPQKPGPLTVRAGGVCRPVGHSPASSGGQSSCCQPS